MLLQRNFDGEFGEQGQLDNAAEEYSRLQIELAAVAAYQNVERTAEDKLGMSFPEEVQRVEP